MEIASEKPREYREEATSDLHKLTHGWKTPKHASNKSGLYNN